MKSNSPHPNSRAVDRPAIFVRLATFLLVYLATAPAGISADLNGEYRRIDAPELAVSFEIPADWVSETREGTRLWRSPGEKPEATLSLQLIDNTSGNSNLDDQITRLRKELSVLPNAVFVDVQECNFANQAGRLLIGQYQRNPEPAESMAWLVLSRGKYFYWLGMTFPQDKWTNGYDAILNRLDGGLRFTPLHKEAITESSTVARDILHDIRAGRFDAAYARTDDTFRQSTTRPAFETFVNSQSGLSNFPWFRILNNQGDANVRQLLIELAGESREAAPFVSMNLKRDGTGAFKVALFYFDKAQRVPKADPPGPHPGFTKVTIKEAGFSGFFPEEWVMTPQVLPEDGGTMFRFRPFGSGFERDHRNVSVMMIRPEETPTESLDNYCSLFSGEPGFQRSENYEDTMNGLPAVASTFRLDLEDDAGFYSTANTVIVVRSRKGLTAILHFVLESGEFSESFDSFVKPVMEEFRFL